MGSGIHTIGMGLAFAMDLGRVLIYHLNSTWIYASKDHCAEDMLTPDCYLHTLSRCQYMAQSLLDEGVRVYSPDNFDWLTAKSLVLQDFWALWGRFVPHGVPDMHDWHKRRGKKNIMERVSWWRAITARFLVRPKPILYKFAQEYFTSNLKRYPEVEGWSPSTDPPPNDVVCMHVRHGDKIIKQAVYSMAQHMDALEEILSKYPDSITRNVFMTFDNDTLVDEMHKGMYDKYNVTFYYTTYDRQRDDSSSMAMAARVPGFGAISLANRFLGVHPNCAAFVEMGGSNWCRLIDEFRRTDGVRAKVPYHDFAPGEWRRSLLAVEQD